MKRKITVVLGLVAICFMTGCSKTPEISYEGKDLIHDCTAEQVDLFVEDVNVMIGEKQNFVYVDNNYEHQEFTDGKLEFNEENRPDVKSCFFVNREEQKDNKFASRSAISFRDPVEGSMRISVSGNYSFKIIDSKTFKENYTTTEELTNKIQTQINAVYIMNMQGKTYSDLSQEKELDETKLNAVNTSIAKYGIEVTKINIEAVEKK